MRLIELYESPKDSIELNGSNLPMGVRYSLPHTLIFPDMNNEWEFYQFAVAMAAHPEISDEFYKHRPLRDVPIAVAYTEQEYEMIKAVAKRMGKKVEEIAFKKSQESPGVNTVSPVMKFNMTESHIDIMKALYETMYEG